MKVVTWNCSGALRKKHHALDELQPDLLVIQECENPAESTHHYREWAGTYLWSGENKNKGIGVFAKAGARLAGLDWNNEGLQSFLPCKVNDAIDLVAVWTKYANSPNFRYIGQLWKYLNLHGAKMQGKPTLLVGDFNSNSCWDEWDRWWNHSDVVRMLSDRGLYSTYHDYFGEEQGKESRPTLYHRKNPEKPYHVDYAFASADLFSPKENSVTIGSMSDWLDLSDHMPLVFTIQA